ncbi:MAG: tetratricopeptide repeat protein [Solirubrobacteraceae bacterium]
MSRPPKITRRPLRVSYDAERDLLLVCEYGAVPQPALEEHLAGITCWLGFLLRKPKGTVIGFILDGMSEIDVDEHDPTLWTGPRFSVPVLGLTDASVAEIVLRARCTFGGASTADVSATRAARMHAQAGEHRAAERELRTALSAGDLRAHITLAGCLCSQGRYREAYDHARIFTQLDPRDSWGFAWLGRAALELGDRGEAETALRRAVRLERQGSHRTPAARALRSLTTDTEDGAA